MRTTVRVVPVAIALVVVVISPIGIGQHSPYDASLASHVVVGSDQRSRDQIAYADAAFRAAGLALPSLEIHVHENFMGCNGFAGLFNRDPGNRVDFCSGVQFTVLHEFAHAWEHHHVDEAIRDAFLELHGLDTWRGHEIPWPQRGAEVAAETIAKGLLTHDLPAWQCREAAVLDEGFRLLTGRRSPRFDEGRHRCNSQQPVQ